MTHNLISHLLPEVETLVYALLRGPDPKYAVALKAIRDRFQGMADDIDKALYKMGG